MPDANQILTVRVVGLSTSIFISLGKTSYCTQAADTTGAKPGFYSLNHLADITTPPPLPRERGASTLQGYYLVNILLDFPYDARLRRV